jgi:hypothetical protein
LVSLASSSLNNGCWACAEKKLQQKMAASMLPIVKVLFKELSLIAAKMLYKFTAG